MTQLPFQCPHCLKDAGFNVIAHFTPDHMRSCFLVFCVCGVCKKGLCVEIESPAIGHFLSQSHDYNFNYALDRCGIEECAILDAYPDVIPSEAPEHAPENIASIYVQAMDAFKLKSYDLAVMGMRKTLEMTVDDILSRLATGSLYHKIDKLKGLDRIPLSMVDWAHEIREIGNEGAHDVVTEKDAQDIVYFAEMFLTYIYTMPAKIALRRAKDAA